MPDQMEFEDRGQTSSDSLLADQISALTRRIGQLRTTERMMGEAKGLEKQLASEQEALNSLDTDIQAEKEKLMELQDQRITLVKSSLATFAEKVDRALPEGQVYINLDEDKPVLGWKIGGKVRPFRALSGGERVAFDLALAFGLGAGLIIKECAELDHKRFKLILEKLKDIPVQTILMSCHQPHGDYPAEWEMVKVGSEV